MPALWRKKVLEKPLLHDRAYSRTCAKSLFVCAQSILCALYLG